MEEQQQALKLIANAMETIKDFSDYYRCKRGAELMQYDKLVSAVTLLQHAVDRLAS